MIPESIKEWKELEGVGQEKMQKRTRISPNQRTNLSIRMEHKKLGASSKKLSGRARLKEEKDFEKLKMKWWEKRKQKRL